MKLLIVRHAESNPDGNGFHHNEGVIGALSDVGKTHAEALAEHLSSYKVGYIYSSDILRAVATAYVISDGMPDVTVMLTKDLRIKDTAESKEEFSKRVANFLSGIQKKYDDQSVVIVSHSDVIMELFNIMGLKDVQPPGLCSVSEIDISDFSEPTVIRINDTKNLA